jgi:hypothetical protein
MNLRLWRLRERRRVFGAIGLVALAALGLAVGAGHAAPDVDLVDPDVRLADGFYPCSGQTDFTRPPLVAECLDGSFQPLRPLVVAAAETACDPGATSTIRVGRRVAGSAFVPGGGWLNGDLSWELTATIGPQSGAAVPSYQPFPNDGVRMDSLGFATGPLESFAGEFSIDRSPAGPGPEDIEGTLALTPNGGNWGVCRTFSEEVSGSPVFGGAPLTGDFYVLNAGVLIYEVTAGPADLVGETGIAEAYLMNTFATCCDAEAPTQVTSASGHFRAQFGTVQAAEGTSGAAPTPTGANVTVTNFAGLDEDVGGVSVAFGNVDAAGETSVTLMTTAPALPAGFSVGDPPAFYEISTTAGVTPPITVCLPFGSLPAGTQPLLLHYESGEWVDRTTSVSGPPVNLVCGVVDSLSPFAAALAPLSAPALILEAASLLEQLMTPRNADKLEDVVAKLEQAQLKLAQTPADRQGAAGELEGAVGDLEAAVKSRRLSSSDGAAVMTLLADAARLLAESAITDAEERGGHASKIAEARAALAAGDSRLDSGRYKAAVARYKDAVAKADSA